MTAPASLDPHQQDVWRHTAMLLLVLPRALEDDLQRGAGIGLTPYSVLMHLSEAPDRRLRMVDLAGRAAMSPSRMTRVVQALEAEGWVTRGGGTSDRRTSLARLTDAGLTRLEAAWPVHLASVRRLVLDHLAGTDLPAADAVLQAVLAAAMTGDCADDTTRRP